MLRRGMLGRALKLWFRLWNSPLGRRSTTVYDLAGQVTASVDPRRHRTRSAHGSARLVGRRAGCAILFRISQWNVRAAKRGSETVCQNASDVAIL
jgi:YD repeat-containing protein